MKTKGVVLLVLNEETAIAQMIPKLNRSWADEWVAVDGGSTDRSVELLTAAGIRVVPQTKRGRGEAFRVGVQALTAELIVFFSPDGNEDPEDIPKLFSKLEDGYDMAIASRFLPGAVNEEDQEAWPLRKWANQFFTQAANAWNKGTPITDTINGFRGLSRVAFQKLAPVSLGFTIEYELTIHSFRQKLRICEIPTKEGQRLGGETKAPSLKTGLTFSKFLLRELFCDGKPK